MVGCDHLCVASHRFERAVAVCNRVRSFDIEARVRDGSARFIETIDQAIAEEIVARVVSAIDSEA